MSKHLIVRAEIERADLSIEDASAWAKRLCAKLKTEPLPTISFAESETHFALMCLITDLGHIALTIHKQSKVLQLDVCCSKFSVGDVMPFVQEFSPHKMWYKFIDRSRCIQEIDNSFRDMEYFGKGLSWVWWEE